MNFKAIKNKVHSNQVPHTWDSKEVETILKLHDKHWRSYTKTSKKILENLKKIRKDRPQKCLCRVEEISNDFSSTINNWQKQTNEHGNETFHSTSSLSYYAPNSRLCQVWSDILLMGRNSDRIAQQYMSAGVLLTLRSAYLD